MSSPDSHEGAMREAKFAGLKYDHNNDEWYSPKKKALRKKIHIKNRRPKKQPYSGLMPN